MIDNITICNDVEMSTFPPAENNVFEHRGLTFIPRYSQLGEIYQYDTDLKNLRIKVRPASNQVINCNSLHKYAHGNNYTDYPLTELRDTIQELSDILDINVFKGSIKKIEYGCNIPVDDATRICQRLVSYQNKSFQPQWHKGQQYGASCYFNNYEIKGYNKAMQVKAVDGLIIPDNLLRWEIKVSSMAALHKRKIPIAIEKVEDLLNVDKAQALADDAVRKYKNAIKNCAPSLGPLSLREITAFARMSDPAVSNFIKLNHGDTYNNDRRLFREVMKASAAGQDNLVELMEEKFKQLIYS